MPNLKTYKDYKENEDVKDIHDKYAQTEPKYLNRADNAEQALEVLSQHLWVDENGKRTIRTPTGEEIILDKDKLRHIVEKRDAARERFANFIIPTLKNAFEIWSTPYEHDIKRDVYIGLYKGKYDFSVIVEVNDDGSIVYNAFQRQSRQINKLRKGKRKYRQIK